MTSVMDRRAFVFGSVVAMLTAPVSADAQQAGRVARVGWLTTTPPTPDIWEAFLGELSRRGWVKDRNMLFERRFSYGQAERFPDLAGELVRLKVDVIVTSGTPAGLAAKNATAATPIVMATVIDPVGVGLVASLARPGGNVTGTSWLGSPLHAKRLELLKEAVPGISRVAVLSNPANPAHTLAVREMQAVAPTLKITLQLLEAKNQDDFGTAFTTMTRSRPDALFTVADPLTFAERTRIVEFAAKNRLPAIYEWRDFVELGGLMAYGVNLADLY